MPLRPLWAEIALAALVTELAACTPDVVVHPPPPEERWESPFPPPLDSWVAMDQPGAARYVVSGIRDLGSERGAWLEGRGVVEVLVPPYFDMTFRLQLTLPDSVVRKAGEVTVAVSLNGEAFTSETFDKPGWHVIEKPIKAGSLPWDRNTEIAVTIEPARQSNWAPGKLGFHITSVGFH